MGDYNEQQVQVLEVDQSVKRMRVNHDCLIKLISSAIKGVNVLIKHASASIKLISPAIKGVSVLIKHANALIKLISLAIKGVSVLLRSYRLMIIKRDSVQIS